MHSTQPATAKNEIKPFEPPPELRDSFEGDPLAAMARLRLRAVTSETGQSEQPTLEVTVCQMLNEQLDREPTAWSQATHKVMLGVMEGLRGQLDVELKIRSVSEVAVLTVARRFGNVVVAGKAAVLACREGAELTGIKSCRAAEQAGIGAAQAVMRVGPIVFPVFRRELSPLIENFDSLLTRSRILPAVPAQRPIIVDCDSSEVSRDDVSLAEEFALDMEWVETSREEQLLSAAIGAEVVEDESAAAPLREPASEVGQRPMVRVAGCLPPPGQRLSWWHKIWARLRTWVGRKARSDRSQ